MATATASASTSVGASTWASPAAGTIAVGSAQSSPKAPPLNALMVHETTTATGGGGNPETLVITDDGDENCTAQLEPAAKRQKKCTSKVWEYFTRYKQTVKNDRGVMEEQAMARCKRCSRVFGANSVNGTKSLWNHLERIHSLKRGQQEVEVKLSEVIPTVENFKYDPQVSLNKFYKAIVMHEYPFSMVEHEYFVDFVKSLRPSFAFKCCTTTRNEILEIFEAQKKVLCAELKSLSNRISTTMNMWTSNRNKVYMCITAHWIDDNWQMQKRILRFIHIKGQHTGIKLANAYVKGLMSVYIEKRVFALTLDNASSNNVFATEAVKELNKLYKLNKMPPMICDGAFFHVKSLCHILDLVAQDGLKVIASSVKNIRATIAIVKDSPLQWEEFQKCAVECDLDIKKELPLDVPTSIRWNSTYDMLDHAIYYRRAFERLLFLHEGKYEKCAPTTTEWDMAESLCKCLEKFNDATMIFSACQYPTANLFWLKCCEIKLSLAAWRASADDTIAHMAEAMQTKYDKYWEKSNLALAVACFLDPRFKQKLVEYFLSKIYPDKAADEIKRVMDAVHKLFQAYKFCVTPESSKSAAVGHQPLGDIALGLGDIEEFLYEDAHAAKCGDKNELEVYLSEKPIRWVDPTGKGENFDVLSWWKGNQLMFPILSRLARDVLAVQISIVASESAFSAGGRVVNPFHSSLESEVIEALICTKDWEKSSRKGRFKDKIETILDELDLKLDNKDGNETNMNEEAHQNGKDLTRVKQRQVLLGRECQQKGKRSETDQNCVATDGIEMPSTTKKFSKGRSSADQVGSHAAAKQACENWKNVVTGDNGTSETNLSHLLNMGSPSPSGNGSEYNMFPTQITGGFAPCPPSITSCDIFSMDPSCALNPSCSWTPETAENNINQFLLELPPPGSHGQPEESQPMDKFTGFSVYEDWGSHPTSSFYTKDIVFDTQCLQPTLKDFIATISKPKPYRGWRTLSYVIGWIFYNKKIGAIKRYRVGR